MDKATARKERILAALDRNNVLSIKALAAMFGVSSMTIRRDLEFLSRQNMVKFYHGGAIYNPAHGEKNGPNDYILQRQKLLHIFEKTRIARRAAGLVQSQETIMLDAGTSIYYLARELRGVENITVICWSLNVLEELIQKPLTTVLLQGGIYHHESQMFENNQGMDTIKNSRASTAFISAGGFHPALGITSAFHYEVETKREAINCSMKCVLLLDSSKFGRVCSAHITGINSFNTIVTDAGIPPEYREYIEGEGIELIIV
ncbi:MAG: DeoR/GlpR family DNA-binding transcription regulator [Treponema sp.]|jgi:DeoR family deoxyribose operon repressor|nr:DeoR/GlpR family DNA-binding transcription regulator [Treponema sp.]